MTNAEMNEKFEGVLDALTCLLRQCERDKAKIDDGLWKTLCDRFGEIEDYLL